jgi:uncharacterized protein (PEP-CTERM system associated)
MRTRLSPGAGAPVVHALLAAALLLPALASRNALAQAEARKITPTLETRLTWTDNVGADSTGTDRSRGADWIAEISPGLVFNQQSGRVRGTLDARMRNLMHATASELDTRYLALQGHGEFEALKESLFIDLQASISRNNRSTFSGRYSGDELSADKRDETRLWSLGPRFEFRFGNSGKGSAAQRTSWLQGGSNTLGDQRSEQWTLKLDDAALARRVGWGLDLEQSNTHYSGEEANTGTAALSEFIARSTLFVRLSSHFRVRGIVGHETNDYGLGGSDRGSVLGAGFDWVPSERSALSVTAEKRPFGNAYDLRFTQRKRRLAWQLTAKQDISTTLKELSQGYALTQAYQDLLTQLAASPSGALLTEEQLQAQARTLYQAGNPDTLLANTHYLNRTLGTGVTFTGPRNTLTVTLQHSEREPLTGTRLLAIGDEGLAYDSVRTRSAALSFNHKLNSLSTLNTAFTRSSADGEGNTHTELTRSIFSIGLVRNLGRHASGGLQYRHQTADGSRVFTENALTATLGMKF